MVASSPLLRDDAVVVDIFVHEFAEVAFFLIGKTVRNPLTNWTSQPIVAPRTGLGWKYPFDFYHPNNRTVHLAGFRDFLLTVFK